MAFSDIGGSVWPEEISLTLKSYDGISALDSKQPEIITCRVRIFRNMAGFTFSTTGDHRETPGLRKPATDTESKSVMLRAELRDQIDISSIEDRFTKQFNVPRDVQVKQRTNTYYGPKLLVIDDAGREYLITAPGPDCYLCLWVEEVNSRGKREHWTKLAEVRAALTEAKDGYHLCPQCNEPLQSADHERQSMLGNCPKVS